ncbi:hypothetical protein AS149_13635 [Burkholderia cenocepacia]|nr:hypothetical protein AS149_13635 [Burkholderia cenocepacia]
MAQSAIDALRAYRTRFPEEASLLVQAEAQLDSAQPDVLLRSNMTGHVTTSMLVVDPAARKVLLIAHGIYVNWMPPGGHFEPAASLWASAAREVLEETGVTALHVDWAGVGSREQPLDIDTHPIPTNPKKREGAHFHHDFTFVGVASSADPLTAQEEEVDGVQWVPFEDLQQSPLDRVRRLGAKLMLLSL